MAPSLQIRARMRHCLALTLVPLAVLALPACASDGTEDNVDDSFTGADGKADGYGLSDAETAGVLELVNTASRYKLDNSVGLSTRVATNITNHRAGPDGKLDTADDNDFDTLVELDKVPYVGKTVFAALLKYARAHGYVKSGGFCKTEHSGTTPAGAAVLVCDTLFDSPPYVHVPANTTSGTTATLYGGVLSNLGLELTTADGKTYALVDSSGNTYAWSNAPSGLKAPHNLFAVYKVTGTLKQVSGADAIQVKTIAPVSWIPGAVQDKLMLGTWEATAAGRVGTDKFDKNTPVKFRFTMKTTADNTPLWTHLGGGDGLTISGAIDNWTSGVKAANGTCLKSLASLGTGSPFYMATQNRLTLWRHPNMHGLNDEVIVMDYPTGSVDLSMNGMGWIGAFTPTALIQTSGPDYTSIEIRPHATPNGALLWNFAKVTTGGTTCP
jgi:hypothetical protein